MPFNDELVAELVRKGESARWLDGGSFAGRAGVPGTPAIAAQIRPKRQRGLAESQQAPARSYFCSAGKASLSSRRSTSLSKIVLCGSG
jgi:hypothetical protein